MHDIGNFGVPAEILSRLQNGADVRADPQYGGEQQGQALMTPEVPIRR
jgi:hypothetical protein